MLDSHWRGKTQRLWFLLLKLGLIWLSPVVMLEPLEVHPADSQCRDHRGKNVTLIGAIALSGFLTSFTFVGWTDKNASLTYVKQILGPQLWSGCCVIMDNLPAHKASQVRAVGDSVEFLSPDFPDFNQARKLLVKN